MFLTVTYSDNQPTPYVWSNPPRTPSDEATVMVEPFGPDKSALFDEDADLEDIPAPEKGSVNLSLSLAEAEDLAKRLYVVVQAAKEGVYSTMGEELKKFTKKKRLDDAWDTLVNDDSAPEE